MQKITFKTLSKGNFRCNQTNEVTKDPKGYKYAKNRAFLAAPKVSAPQKGEKPKILMEHALMFAEGAIS